MERGARPGAALRGARRRLAALVGPVVGRAVVGTMVTVMMMVRGGERRRCECEHASDEEEFLHDDQNGTNGWRMSVEF